MSQLISSFSIMFFDNGKLFDNLVGHAFGLEVHSIAILLKLWVKSQIKIKKTLVTE